MTSDFVTIRDSTPTTAVPKGIVVAMGNFDAEFYITQAFYWVPLIALMFTRNKWVDTALLAALCLYYVLGAFVLGW